MRRKRLKAFGITFVALTLSLVYTTIIYVVSKARNLEVAERKLLAELGCERFVFVFNFKVLFELFYTSLIAFKVQSIRCPINCERPPTGKRDDNRKCDRQVREM